MMTLQERCDEHRIEMTATYVDHVAEGEWPHDEWLCTLKAPDREPMDVPMRMGLGHHCNEPTREEVLQCVLTDATTVANGETFSEWCRELGYSDDSRKAERMYAAVIRQTKRLRKFLGPAFDTFLYETEQ